MKKVLATIFLFIMCASFCFQPTLKVKADTTVDFNTVEEVVYYQAILSSGENSPVYAFNAVSQYYYKNETNLSGESNGARQEYKNTTFKSINNTNICENDFNFTSKSTFCKGTGTKELIPHIAALKLTRTGDIYIQLANGATINNLRIYYIIANKSNEAQLFCDENAICPNAKKVLGENSNWKNYSKTGNLVYGESTIAGAFNKGTTESGIVNYTGFNLFEKMEAKYATLAQNAGVYVLTSMSVEFKGVDYYVGDYNINTRTFSDIGNVDNSSVKFVDYLENPISANSYNNITAITKLSLAAGLVMPGVNLNPDGQKGYSLLNDFMKETLKPILMIVVGVMFIIAGITNGITIVKSSDEPEVRRDAIKRLVGTAIAVLIIELILIFYEDIIEAISNFL